MSKSSLYDVLNDTKMCLNPVLKVLSTKKWLIFVSKATKHTSCLRPVLKLSKVLKNDEIIDKFLDSTYFRNFIQIQFLPTSNLKSNWSLKCVLKVALMAIWLKF